MAVKVKDLIAFLQKHETEDWKIACLEFDDYHGLWISLFSNEKEIPNKTNYFDDGPAYEWDHLAIKADTDLDNVKIKSSHETDDLSN